eukprot:883208-Amphidinium_carterae.1
MVAVQDRSSSTTQMSRLLSKTSNVGAAQQLATRGVRRDRPESMISDRPPGRLQPLVVPGLQDANRQP